MLNGQLPVFTRQDNPTAFEPVGYHRALSYTHLAVLNLKLLLFPFHLSYDWQMSTIEPVRSVADTRNIFSLVFLLLLAMITTRLLKSFGKYGKDKKLVSHQGCLAFLFLVFPYLPASNLFVTVGFVLAERTLYMPSVGFTLVFAIGMNQIHHYFPKLTHRNTVQQLLRVLVFIWLSAFALKTVQRNQQWLSRASLFESALTVVPSNAKVHYNYANLQKDVGNLDLAIVHYQTAIGLWPDYESAHNNLGAILKDCVQAEHHFRQALRINPFHARAHFNLANIYSKQGLLEKAAALLRRSIELNPGFAEPYSRLASLNVDQGLLTEAGHLHRYALHLQPHNSDLVNNYAAYLQQIGHTRQALYMYRTALRLKPSHAIATENVQQIAQQLAVKSPFVADLLIRMQTDTRQTAWLSLLNNLLTSPQMQSVFGESTM